MADLPTGAVGAVENPPVHHNAAADSGAQGNQDHTVVAPSPALPAFAQCRHIGVVARFHRQPREIRQHLLDGKGSPSQIGTSVYHAVPAHGTRNPDAKS